MQRETWRDILNGRHVMPPVIFIIDLLSRAQAYQISFSSLETFTVYS